MTGSGLLRRQWYRTRKGWKQARHFRMKQERVYRQLAASVFANAIDREEAFVNGLIGARQAGSALTWNGIRDAMNALESRLEEDAAAYGDNAEAYKMFVRGGTMVDIGGSLFVLGADLGEIGVAQFDYIRYRMGRK